MEMSWRASEEYSLAYEKAVVSMGAERWGLLLKVGELGRMSGGGSRAAEEEVWAVCVELRAL